MMIAMSLFTTTVFLLNSFTTRDNTDSSHSSKKMRSSNEQRSNFDIEQVVALNVPVISNVESPPDTSFKRPQDPRKTLQHQGRNHGVMITPSRNARQDAVRNATMFVWNNYKSLAFGADELTPISGQAKNNWGGLAATLIDSLDTLWVMDLKDDFHLAQNWVAANLTFDHLGSINVFGTSSSLQLS